MEHLLAKEGVAGSIPVSRLKKERYQIGIVLFFRALVWARKFDVYAPLRSAQSEVPRTSCAVSRFLPLDFFKKFLFHVTSDKFLLLHSLPLNYLLNQMLYNQIIM